MASIAILTGSDAKNGQPSDVSVSPNASEFKLANTKMANGDSASCKINLEPDSWHVHAISRIVLNKQIFFFTLTLRVYTVIRFVKCVYIVRSLRVCYENGVAFITMKIKEDDVNTENAMRRDPTGEPGSIPFVCTLIERVEIFE